MEMVNVLQQRIDASVRQTATMLAKLGYGVSDVLQEFVKEVVDLRARKHGTLEKAAKDRWNQIAAGANSSAMSIAGWLIESSRNPLYPERPQSLPTFQDVVVAVRVLGFDTELVAAWLDLDQSKMGSRLRGMHLVYRPSDFPVAAEDLPAIHNFVCHLTNFGEMDMQAVVFPDAKSLSVLGRLSDEELIAICSTARPAPTSYPNRAASQTNWFPDLANLARYWAAPPEKKFYWKNRNDFTLDEIIHFRKLFPGTRMNKPSPEFVAIARGYAVPEVYPQLTVVEVHEFLYTTDWHHADWDAYDPEGTPTTGRVTPPEFLAYKLGLAAHFNRLPPNQFMVMRWFGHQLDRGKIESMYRLRTFRDSYALPYRSSYMNRLDELRDSDIERISDGLARVFARVDARLKKDVEINDPTLDDPLCETPPFAHWLPDGWRVLTTRRQLIEEGQRLRHCVAGFHHGLKEGASYILSIRSPEGMSTVELRRAPTTEGTKESLTVIQHRSIRNGPPPKEHERRLQEIFPNLFYARSLSA